MEANFIPSKKPEYSLMILGNTGTGKSNICNMIIGYERFETDFRREAVKTVTEHHRIDAGASDLLIYNVPGLIESDQEAVDRNKREIMKTFEQSSMPVVMFVWTQVDGRPHPDDIIAFKALYEAYRFSPKSFMFVVNNVPSKRPPTYEGNFCVMLRKMLNPISISLEDMFFLDTLDSKDNENFSATRNRLITFIAEHHENEHKLQANIIVEYNELRIQREVLKKLCLAGKEDKQAFKLQIQQTTEEYETVMQAREKRYQDMLFILGVTKQQGIVEEKLHEPPGGKLEGPHKEKKTSLKDQYQQFRTTIKDEKGILKKAEKCYEIAKDELHNRYKSNEHDEEKNFKKKSSKSENEHERNGKCHEDQPDKGQNKFINRFRKNSDCSDRSPIDGGVIRAACVGAAAGAVTGAGFGAAVGILLGPCAVGTAVVGAAAGTAVGAAAGVTIYKCHKHHKNHKNHNAKIQ